MTAAYLTTLSPAQLNKMLKADIIAEILNGVTHRSATQEQDEHGNAVRMDEIITDAYGQLVGTREILWIYYPTGEVNTITVKEFDPEHRLTGGYAVKHFRDGKQPILNPIKPEPR